MAALSAGKVFVYFCADKKISTCFKTRYMNIDKKYLGISEPLQAYIEVAVADGILEEKEIQLLRRKAQEFGDDPDEVEMIVKAECAREQKANIANAEIVHSQKTNSETQDNTCKKQIIDVIPRKNIFIHSWNALKNYAVFKNRASRAEFWQFLLLNYSITIALLFVIGNLSPESNSDLDTFIVLTTLLFIVVMILPFFSCWARRIHDTNKSAWFILLPVYNILLLFIRGTKGDNRFGNDPYKPIQKEICIKNKDAKQREKQVAKIISKLEIFGGILFAVGTTVEELLKKGNNAQLFDEMFGNFNKWLWPISGAFILFPRIINWIKRCYAKD
jgi:uncharacterized membrane protein YhaH (DUF805 family)